MTLSAGQSFGTPYKATNITAAWVKAGLIGVSMALGSSATNFYCIPGFFPANGTSAANAFNNASSARRGARFRLPIDCYISGFRYFPGAGIGDFTASILDSSSVEIGGSATTFSGAASPGVVHGCQNLFFDSEVGPLATGTDYYLALAPSTATNINLYTYPLTNNNFRKAWPGGVDFDYATGTPTMAAVDTSVPLLDLLISRLPIGGGSGGGGFAGIIGM
jgi:hypothetical protein